MKLRQAPHRTPKASFLSQIFGNWQSQVRANQGPYSFASRPYDRFALNEDGGEQQPASLAINCCFAWTK